MYKNLIRKYINDFKLEHINKFCINNNIVLKNGEDIIIYNFIKENYEDILNNNINVFFKLKNNISNNTYNVIMNLYNTYKDKI